MNRELNFSEQPPQRPSINFAEIKVNENERPALIAKVLDMKGESEKIEEERRKRWKEGDSISFAPDSDAVAALTAPDAARMLKAISDKATGTLETAAYEQPIYTDWERDQRKLGKYLGDA